MNEVTPHILDREHDPRVLRDLAKMLEKEVLRQQEVIKKILEEKAKTSQQKINIEESLLVLRNKYFGRSSEKSSEDRSRERLDENPELLLHSQNLVPLPSKKQTRELKVEELVHELSEEELKLISEEFGLSNPSGSQWEEIVGLFDQSTEIEILERSYKKILHKRKKYRLKKEFKLEEKEVIIAAAGAVKLVPGCSYSIDFTVASIIDKYLNHLPLERQCRMMASVGLEKMQTQVLYNLARLAGVHLEKVVERIKDEVLSRPLVHSDETTWPINNSKDSDGYMWIVSNNCGSYYRFEPTRSGKVIKETLEKFKGTIMTDGYSGYYQFKSSQVQKLALCHAHARRYFFEIKETNPAVQFILDCWRDLSSFEYLARDFEELKKIRQEKSKPLIESMKIWLYEQLPEARAESKLKEAIQYSLNHWPELIKFLDDPMIPLTNNEAERAIRQAVMGRKNFYGSRSIDGADLAAIMYTIIETCKKFELDPRNYLSTTLKNAAANKQTETPFEMAKQLRQ